MDEYCNVEDHSKNLNLDMLPTCSTNAVNLDSEEGIKIDGVHYRYAPLLFDTGIFQAEDCTGFSDFELSDTTDESEQCNVISPCASLNATISTDDDSIDKIDQILKKRKREHDCCNASVPLIHIKQQKQEHYEKRKEMCCAERKKKVYCKKRKKNKRVINDDNNDDDDDCISKSSSQSSYCKFKKSRQSPTTLKISTLEYSDVRINEECMQASEIFGYYFCEVCNIELSSEKVYSDHMNGKRHQKNLKSKYVEQALIKAIPPCAATEGQSKYPKPPHGVIRRKVRQRAKIQDVIKNEVKKPCPGLYLVTEIQGLKETQYYCSICNAICSANSIISHLTGFKHQLNSVKYFRPGDYEYMCLERKNLIQDRMVSILRAIQKREGLGRMTVEVEELVSDSNDIVPYDMIQPRASMDMKDTSLKLSGMSFTEYYDKAAIPNKSSSDYYCQYCDAHMNSEDMWQSHITGKRHIINLKKLPGDQPSKTKTIPLPNVRAKLLDRFEDECPDEPIVGLNEIREVQRKETDSVYNCFLCCSCHTFMDIIEHLVSLKHRKKYLDHIKYPYMQHISGMSELSSTPIIRQICSDIEAKKGCGKPSVHMNKSDF